MCLYFHFLSPSPLSPLSFQSSDRQEAQTQYTYVCDETLDPTFLGQKFLFSVNEKASLEPRQYRIRVVVKTKENLRVSRFLGMADIHLTCLKNEQEIEVKFSLFLLMLLISPFFSLFLLFFLSFCCVLCLNFSCIPEFPFSFL
jgi:C2 domain